jgi:2-iminobutanoate/2-iminopropanoate deaminase
MQTTQHNPSEIFPPQGPYCHGVEVKDAKRLLFISGTVGLDREGKPPAEFEAQCRLLWSNIQAILRSAGMEVTNLVKITGFIADKKYRGPNMRIREEVLGSHRVATTVVVAELLESAWLLEIEAVAAA